jgi:MFS family permease
LSIHNKPNSFLLLFGLGISTLGDFIYLVAINVLILQLTGSAVAVAGLWIIGPIANLLTKFWSGSLIDRMNYRKIMIVTDIIRACLVVLLSFVQSIWLIYIVLFFLAVSKAFFEPASMTYITSIVSKEDRKQFNSFRSVITSGAFLVGPAISGALLLVTTVHISLWINAISFVICACMLYCLPDAMSQKEEGIHAGKVKVLVEDWKAVIQFSRTHMYVVQVYFLAQFLMIVALGMDAQEVVFIQEVLHLSETDYGLLISIVGIGSILGAWLVATIAKKISIKNLLNIGYVMVSIGYLIYAFSFSFSSVVFGFIIIGFFSAFSGTGFMTFYQNNVPVAMMGRITSIFGTFQSLLQIIFIISVGFTGDLLPLRYSIIVASILMLSVSIMQIILINRAKYKQLFDEGREDVKIS